MRNRILLILMVMVAVSFAACSGGGGEGGESALVKAQTLNKNANGYWDGVMGSYQAIQDNIEMLAAPPTNLAGAMFDVQEVQDMLQTCFDSPIALVEGAGDQAAAGDMKGLTATGQAAYSMVKDCASVDSLTGYKGGVSSEVGSFAEEKVMSVDMIRKDVLYTLPEAVKAAPALIEDWSGLAAEILADAESTFQTASNNPMASADEINNAKAEYEAIQAEITSLQGLLDRMSTDITSIPNELTALVNRVTAEISDFTTNVGNALSGS
jgi:prefoldin subunit 5